MPSGRAPDFEPCSLCQRLVPRRLITLHHLKPKERGGRAEHRTPLCKPCHKQLHATYSNKELDRELDSLESLRNAAELQPFLRWIRKQKPGRNFQTSMSHGHPHKGRERRRWR
jgi:5-methylcytosine-specific restriction protein A